MTNETTDKFTSSVSPAVSDVTAVKRKGGRPKRVSLAQPVASEREPLRQPMRDDLRPADWGSRKREQKWGDDDLYFDPKLIPAGHSYEWKRIAVWNEPDAINEINLARNGWSPVPLSRHRKLMPPGWNRSNTIDRGGLRLYERPMHLTEEARQDDRDNAMNQIMARKQFIGQAHGGNEKLRQYNKLAVDKETVEEYIPKE